MNVANMTLYFEDLSVGNTFDAGRCTISKEGIFAFAERFGPQPFHVDEDAGADSLFGELISK